MAVEGLKRSALAADIADMTGAPRAGLPASVFP